MDTSSSPYEDESESSECEPFERVNNNYTYPTTSKKGPDYNRREYLAKPPIRRLLASGFYALRTGNEQILSNLENMLCCSLRETVSPGMTEPEWREYAEKYVEAHRPKSPVDPDKFNFDGLDSPVFYDEYQECRSNVFNKYRMYNYRGVPKPLPSKVLNYTPTERILELSKPRQYPKYTIGKSRLTHRSAQRINQRQRIIESELEPLGVETPALSIQGTRLVGRYSQQGQQMINRGEISEIMYLPQTIQHQSMLPQPLQNAPVSYYQNETSLPVIPEMVQNQPEPSQYTRDTLLNEKFDPEKINEQHSSLQQSYYQNEMPSQMIQHNEVQQPMKRPAQPKWRPSQYRGSIQNANLGHQGLNMNGKRSSIPVDHSSMLHNNAKLSRPMQLPSQNRDSIQSENMASMMWHGLPQSYLQCDMAPEMKPAKPTQENMQYQSQRNRSSLHSQNVPIQLSSVPLQRSGPQESYLPYQMTQQFMQAEDKQQTMQPVPQFGETVPLVAPNVSLPVQSSFLQNNSVQSEMTQQPKQTQLQSVQHSIQHRSSLQNQNIAQQTRSQLTQRSLNPKNQSSLPPCNCLHSETLLQTTRSSAIPQPMQCPLNTIQNSAPMTRANLTQKTVLPPNIRASLTSKRPSLPNSSIENATKPTLVTKAITEQRRSTGIFGKRSPPPSSYPVQSSSVPCNCLKSETSNQTTLVKRTLPVNRSRFYRSLKNKTSQQLMLQKQTLSQQPFAQRTSSTRSVHFSSSCSDDSDLSDFLPCELYHPVHCDCCKRAMEN